MEAPEIQGLLETMETPEIPVLTGLTAPVVVPAVRDHPAVRDYPDHPALVGSPLQTAPTLLSTV